MKDKLWLQYRLVYCLPTRSLYSHRHPPILRVGSLISLWMTLLWPPFKENLGKFLPPTIKHKRVACLRHICKDSDKDNIFLSYRCNILAKANREWIRVWNTNVMINTSHAIPAIATSTILSIKKYLCIMHYTAPCILPKMITDVLVLTCSWQKA